MQAIIERLNPQQKAAVCHGRGPALVLAGPGSGKTTVITARTVYLIEELGLDPGSILTLTFNRAAKIEMEERFQRLCGDKISQQVRFSTLHSFGNRVVIDYEKMKERRLKRIEGDESGTENKRSILRRLYREINGTAAGDEELDQLSNEIGFVKNLMLTNPEELKNTTPGFAGIYRAYEEYKRANLLMDFDDMLSYAYAILRNYPDLLYRYRQQYPFVQVDEGQDLSRLQFELLKLLIWPHNNLFLVGDDDQSIYAFRGAAPEYVLGLRQQLPGCRVYKLEQNYRSSRNIVDISSQFIKTNRNRYDKQHRTDNPELANPAIIKVRDEAEQLEQIIRLVRERWQQQPGCSIAILYRNNLSSLLLAEGLEREGIGMKLKQSQLYFFRHWVIQDLLACLRLALNPADREAFARIGSKIKGYFSRELVEKALNGAPESGPLDSLLQFPELSQYQRRLVTELKGDLVRLARSRPATALEFIEKNWRYFDSLKKYCQSQGLNFDYYYSLYQELKSLAGSHPTIAAFLQRLLRLEQLFEQGRSMSGKSPQVTLSTIHSAKGLEYDCVLMVDLCNQEIPGPLAIERAGRGGDQALLEEERRLFYVGMTRARSFLYLLVPRRKRGAEVQPSLFVEEVMACLGGEIADGIKAGTRVYHKKFGAGIVVEVETGVQERSVIVVDFAGVRRNLDLMLCLENGILQMEEC